MRRLLIIAAACLSFVSCADESQIKLIPSSDYETVVDGKKVSLYTLKNGDLSMQVTNFGGRVVSLWTPDRDGDYEDIVCHLFRGGWPFCFHARY